MIFAPGESSFSARYATTGRIEARGECPGSDLPRLEAQPGYRLRQADRVDRRAGPPRPGTRSSRPARPGLRGKTARRVRASELKNSPRALADVVLRRRDDEAEDARRPELFPDLEEELPGVVAVDLGRRRFGEIEQDGVVAVGRPLEERPVRPRGRSGRGDRRARPRAGPDRCFRASRMIAGSSSTQSTGGRDISGASAAPPLAPPPTRRTLANGVPLQEREVDGLLRGPGVRMAEDGQAVVEEGDLFLVPDDWQLAVARVFRLRRDPGASTRLVESPGRIRPEAPARHESRQGQQPGPAGSHPGENEDRGRGADDRRALPIATAGG